MEIEELAPERETMLAIGVFDGVHLGHQWLLEQLKKQAQKRNWLSGVITFTCHPQAVLSPETRPTYLTSLEERTSLLKSLGIEIVVALPFTAELAQLSAREFVALIQKRLRMRGLVIGPDFALGRGREGNATALREIGKELDFTVWVVPPLTLEGSIVSSTAIRQALSKGEVATAAKLLGRYFSLKGKVTHGDERGKILGFPTANLELDSEQATPADGVYITRAYIEARSHKAVANIGIRPTFGTDKRAVEVYLLDFEGDLYGYELKIELIERIRPEIHFPTVDALVTQIGKDVEQARAALE